MQCAQYATYNSLGVCSKARSALTTAPRKEKKLLYTSSFNISETALKGVRLSSPALNTKIII